MRPSSESKQPLRCLLSVTPSTITICRTPSALLSSDLLAPSGSLDVFQPAPSSISATLRLTPRKSASERSSWNCAKRTRLWSDVYALPNLVHLHNSSKSSMSSKNCSLFSDSSPRMTKIPAAYSVSSHSFLWLSTSARRRTECTPWAPCSTPEKTNRGRLDSVSQETSLSLLTPSAVTSLIITLSRPSTSCSLIMSQRSRTPPSNLSSRVWHSSVLRESATWFSQLSSRPGRTLK